MLRRSNFLLDIEHAGRYQCCLLELSFLWGMF